METITSRKALFGLLTCLFLTLCAHAQNITFFTSKQGLVNSCIQTLYQDSRHNIWVGTRNGLNRYDGVKMNTYRPSDTSPRSLKYNSVQCIYEYDPDHILIGTSNGLLSYSYATDSFTDVPFINRDGDTINVHVAWMYRLRIGYMIACVPGYGNGCIQADAQGRLYAIQETNYNTGPNNVSPARIIEDRHKNLWVLNNDSELYCRRRGGFWRYDIPGRPCDFCISSSGKLYVGSEHGGLFVYSDYDNTFLPVGSGPSDYNLWSIRAWTDGRILICTDGNGLKVYDEHTGKITQSNIQTNDFNLATANVKDALSDAYGNVWVGIYWRGVMMKPINQSTFEYIGRSSITKNTIGTNPVTAIAPSADRKLWVATDHDGIYRLTADGTSSQHWKPSEQPHMPSSLNALLDDGQGTLWMGGYASGFWSMDTRSGRFTKSRHDISRVFHLAQAPSGDLWISTLGMGFYRYDPRTDEAIHYSNHSDNIRSSTILDPNHFVFCIHPQQDTIYAGTSNGLEVYQLQGRQLIPKDVKLLRHNILCMKPDGQGHLWLGTTNGLYRLDTRTDSLKSYTQEDGLPNAVVNSIELQDGHLWAGTDNGLTCLDIERGSFENYYNEDGLQDNEFSQRASVALGDSLYFGGIGGITFFQKNGIANQKAADGFNIFLVDLYVNNQAVHVGDKSGSYDILDNCVDETRMVNLAYGAGSFSIEVAAPSIGNRHIAYEYSFDGRSWTTQEGNTGRIIIQGLNPGLYKLHIRARTYQAVSGVRILTIHVHHPWYTSPLALIIYLVLAILVCWAVYVLLRRQVMAHRLLQRHRREREINDARIQFFMNISHEIRTPMTLIMAPLEKLMGMDTDDSHQRNYRLIHQNAKRILRLVNQMMDVRKIEKGAYRLDYTSTDLIPFIQNTFDVFTSAAQQRSIDFRFLHEKPSLLVKTDTENLDKILMNLLSNAFKFTPDGGAISVQLETQRRRMLIHVTDTGSGISDEDKPRVFERFYSAGQQKNYIGTGIGLNLTYLLVQLFKGTITVADNPDGQGTRFTVDLPLIRVKEEIPPAAPAPATAQPVADIGPEPLPIEKLRGMKHRNVLIVEDDEAIRQYLHSELSHDMVLTEFVNGAEAWQFIQKHPDKVDLVISDRMMPEMDGLTLCQHIKQNPLTNHLPVILITALGSDADRIEGLTGGADAYVSKPFNIDVLRTTAVNLLQSRLLLQGKFTAEQQTEEKLDKLELSSPDEQLMERVMRVINKNMDNADLNVESFADQVGVSRVHFYRKIKELTGQSPRDFLKTIRLKEAARLLREKNLDITSVSDATGFKTLSTFSTSFKALYGMTPSEYQNANKG